MIKRRTFIQIALIQSRKGNSCNRWPKESNPKALHNHWPEKVPQHDVKIRLRHVPSRNTLRRKTYSHHQAWINPPPNYHKEKPSQSTQPPDCQHIPDHRVWVTSQILQQCGQQRDWREVEETKNKHQYHPDCKISIFEQCRSEKWSICCCHMCQKNVQSSNGQTGQNNNRVGIKPVGPLAAIQRNLQASHCDR